MFGLFYGDHRRRYLNVAMPNMAKNLGGAVSWLQWVVDGYTLTFACLLLSAGSLEIEWVRNLLIFLD
jgi:hypothetical protein